MGISHFNREKWEGRGHVTDVTHTVWGMSTTILPYVLMKPSQTTSDDGCISIVTRARTMSRFVFCFRIQGPHIGSSTAGSLCSQTTQVQVRWYGADSEQRHFAGHLTVSAPPRVQENNGTKSPDLHNFYRVITLLPQPTTPPIIVHSSTIQWLYCT